MPRMIPSGTQVLIAALLFGTVACGDIWSEDATAPETPGLEGETTPTSESSSGKKLALPRLQSKEVRAIVRVEPQPEAQGSDQAGETKTCRVQIILEPLGSPVELNTIKCDVAYTEAVETALNQWRFGPIDGAAFPGPVQIVREIQFQLQ